MFDQLTQRLENTWKKISGQQLTEKNIRDTLQDVRTALIDADVALPVVDQLLDDLSKKALGEDIIKSLTPAHTFLKMVYDEFVDILGSANEGLNIQGQPPAVILVAGLQGAGKTTTVGKLAYHLVHDMKQSVMVASVDVYRPGAIAQLETVIAESGARFFDSQQSQDPLAIAQAALADAKRQYVQVLIIDTAGRLHIDQEMMREIKQIHQLVTPRETLFVVDSMTGQDAANTAKAFHETLPLTGVIITKVDGDARGGAALSVRQITGKPIKFMGMGEKITALERFHPERIASRILGQGDLMSLAEEAAKHMHPQNAEKMAANLKKGQFNLNDFREQIKQLLSMGGLGSLLSKLPGMSQLSGMMEQHGSDKSLRRIIAMIDSMTPTERERIELMLPPSDRNRLPAVMKKSRSRIQRIAKGSGTDPQEVKRLLKQVSEMQKMMKKMKGGGMMNQLAAKMKGLPPGFDQFMR